MIPLSFYPIRLTRVAKESLSGYLYRFYVANGHVIPPPILQLLSYLHGGDSLQRRHTLNRLQAIIGPELLDADTWWIDSDFPFRSLLHIGGLKVCPHCIAEQGFYHSHWDLPLVNACPHHQVRLLKCCSSCRRTLRWGNLRSGWSCGCGLTILKMHADKASQFEDDISATLIDGCYWNDPKSNGDTGVRAVARRASIGAIYTELFQGLGFRSIIVQAMRDRWPGRFQANIRAYPHRWEYRLFSGWPGSFRNVVLRLLERYWRNQHATLILVTQDPALNRILSYLGASTAVPWVIDPLRDACLVLIREYRVPIEIQGLVVFNPRYSQSDRDTRLLIFWRWWHRLLDIQAGKRGFQPLKAPFPSIAVEQSRDALIILILTALIDAANARKSPRRYSVVFARCMLPGFPFHPTTILKLLSRGLIELPHAYLAEMYLALNQLASNTRKCRPPKS